MGSGMSRIVPGLFLGSLRDARDVKQLEQHKITHIVSVHDDAKEGQDGRAYYCIRAADTPKENLSRHFSSVNDFIHRARVDGGHVLVHCLCGVSRSTTLVIAYLMSVTEYDSEKLLSAIENVRFVNPNDGFREQLVQFGVDRVQVERERLRTTFGFVDPNDSVECDKLLNMTKAEVEALRRAAETRTEEAIKMQSTRTPEEGKGASSLPVKTKEKSS